MIGKKNPTMFIYKNRFLGIEFIGFPLAENDVFGHCPLGKKSKNVCRI